MREPIRKGDRTTVDSWEEVDEDQRLQGGELDRRFTIGGTRYSVRRQQRWLKEVDYTGAPKKGKGLGLKKERGLGKQLYHVEMIELEESLSS